MTETIGSRIRDLRERRGLSLAALAPKIGLSKQALWKIETGQSALSVDTLRALAEGLDVPISAFLEEPVQNEVENLRQRGHHLLAIMGKVDLRRAIAVLEALAGTRTRAKQDE